jgi:hypothetical protein
MNNEDITTQDAMDRLLRESMADAAPQLSPAFDPAVLDKVSERRLPRWGRVVMGAYAVGAAAFTLWAMQGLGVMLISVSLGGGALVAFALSRYVRAVAIEA